LQKLEAHFSDYESFHRTKGNELCHYIGIPLILFSTLGLLLRVKFGPLDAAFVVWAFSFVFYLRLNLTFGFLFSLLTFAAYFAGRFVSFEIHLALFIVGWIVQLVGHVAYEHRSPAFLKNIAHVLIGPFWIFMRAIGQRRIHTPDKGSPQGG
jgi:uncharacterized membrane protein YGL010W